MNSERKPLQLFYPSPLGRALDMLRARLSLEAIERDEQGYMTCYTSRQAAAVAARRLGRLSPTNEMFLVVIEVHDQALVKMLTQKASGSLVLPDAQRSQVSISAPVQEMLSTQAAFSLEIVPGTEHKLLQGTHSLIKLSGSDDDGDWF